MTDDDLHTIKIFATNGDTQQISTTHEADGTLRARESVLTSGNGLTITYTTDFDGNVGADRIETFITQADGAWTGTASSYGPDGLLLEQKKTTVSADGLSNLVTWDDDGDGHIDRSDLTVTDMSGTKTETLIDLDVGGQVLQMISLVSLANGTQTVGTYDFTPTGRLIFPVSFTSVHGG